MTSFPPGEWSQILVGDQWPDDQDLAAVQHGRTNRRSIKDKLIDFAESLHHARTGPLTDQQGHTADDLRNAFCRGEDHAREVADKNGTKASAYETAYDCTLSLQHDLTSLANDGNRQIKEIQESKEPTEAEVT
jgi:hypothetical protein